MHPIETNNKRSLNRLVRQPDHLWQLSLNDDNLITRNIVNISPGGLSFKAPMSAFIENGQIVKFKLTLKPGEAFEGEGQIRWSRKPNDKLGQMGLFGFQFLNIPTAADSLIMKEINDSLLRARRHLIEEGVLSPSLNRNEKTKKSIRARLASLFGGIVAATLIVAFFAALWIQEHAHPQDSIAETFNKALARKLSSTQDLN
jgi:hypothetical protein